MENVTSKVICGPSDLISSKVDGQLVSVDPFQKIVLPLLLTRSKNLYPFSSVRGHGLLHDVEHGLEHGGNCGLSFN